MIDPATSVGGVHLTISDLARSIRFYESQLGFELRRRDDRTAWLGAGGPDLLVLSQCETAPRVRGTTGLYHFAILVPTRTDLARALRRLVAADTVMQGAADHGVSEALYLADPDGNGIEIYRDRPRESWRWESGEIAMATEPLDLQALLDEAREPWEGVPGGTVLGHVHLHVARIPAAEQFYREVIGFELTARYGPAASFLSAGGYHHHLAVNTWAGLDAPRPPDDAAGLRESVLVIPGDGEIERVCGRAENAGVTVLRQASSVVVRDPSGNALRLVAG